MKKLSILLIIIILILLFSFNKKEDNSITTFSEYNPNYNIYKLDISMMNINTKNLNKYFNNYQILSIIPYINPIYSNLLNISEYMFENNKSNNENINKFEKIMIENLKKNNLITEVNKFYYNGFKINKINIYCQKQKINELINKYKDIKLDE